MAQAELVNHDDKDFEENSELCEITKEPDSCSSIDALRRLQEVIKKSGEIRKNARNSDGVVFTPTPEERKILTAGKDSDIRKIIKIPSDYKVHCLCSSCGCVHEFRIENKIRRANEVKEFNGTSGSTSLSAVQSLIGTECGTVIEYNPALIVAYETYEVKNTDGTAQTEPELTVNKKDSLNHNVASQKNDVQTQSKCSTNADSHKCRQQSKGSINKKKLQSIFHSEHSTRSTYDIAHDLISYKGRADIINPVTFDYDSFASLQYFNKSALSAGLISAMNSMFAMLSAPKTRITTQLNGMGIDWSRIHITDIVNGAARAFFHGVSRIIHTDMLYGVRTVIMDETGLKVRIAKTAGGFVKKSQIWCMVSGRHENIKAALFKASDTRKSDVVLDLLESTRTSSIDTLITDGYAGYDAAMDEFKKAGINICHASCWTHARRPLHRYMEDTGLLKIYNKYLLPDGSQMSDFMENLLAYEKKHTGTNALSELHRDCLIVYYLINCLFYIDSSAWQESIENGTEFISEIAKYRGEISKPVLNAIFLLIRHIINVNDGIVIESKGRQDGTVKYRKNKVQPVSGALIYLLNQEKKLREFVDKPYIELSSSAAERAIRLGACARHNFQFLNNYDSAQAFADHLTIANTCSLNSVSFIQYTLWLIANVRYRIVHKMMKEGINGRALSMPKTRTEIIEQEDGKEPVKVRIGLYDKENHTVFDEIDYTGLTPYDFRELILRK